MLSHGAPTKGILSTRQILVEELPMSSSQRMREHKIFVKDARFSRPQRLALDGTGNLTFSKERWQITS
jgi:hypothetical protein